MKKFNGFIIGCIILLILAGFGWMPCNAEGLAKTLNAGVMGFAWLCILVLIFLFVFANKIPYNPSESKSRFSNIAYWAMLLTCGNSTGVLCCMFNDTVNIANSNTTGVGLCLMNWCVLQFIIYTTFGVVELLDDKLDLLPKYLRTGKCIFYSVSVMLGLSISLSLGSKTLSNIVLAHLGVKIPTFIWGLLILTLAGISVRLGIDRGLKRFSNVTMWGLTVYSLCLLPMTHDIIRYGGAGIKELITDFFTMLSIDVNRPGYLDTIFYILWPTTWIPFVSKFLAMISKGRKLREMILGCVIAPSVMLAIPFIVGTNIGINTGVEKDLVNITVINSFILFIPYLILMFLMFSTTADSAVLAMDVMIQVPDNKIKVKYRYWILLGMLFLVSTILMILGNESHKFIGDLSLLITPIFPILLIIYIYKLIKKIKL